MTEKLPCQTPQTAYIYEYPQFVELCKKADHIMWLESEVVVDKDVHDIRTSFEPSEKHATIYLLKLFTIYEIFIGNEYWQNRVHKRFPKPCIRRMAKCFSYFEECVHAPFYDQLNKALYLNTKEFYESYKQDDILVERMDFLEEMVSSKDDLLSLAVFSMMEGAVLYSAFAFLKHFQSKGKNKLMNVVRGINFSVKDENFHSIGGAMLYHVVKKEMLERDEKNNLDNSEYYSKVEEQIYNAAKKIYEHECYIIEEMFSQGSIKGITEVQLKHFVESRLNLVLKQLDLKPLWKVTYNPIAEWFYEGINAYQLNDFFSGMGNQYNRNWSESEFIWTP